VGHAVCVCCMTCCFNMKAGKTLTAGSSGGLEHLAASLRTVAVASDLSPLLVFATAALPLHPDPPLRVLRSFCSKPDWQRITGVPSGAVADRCKPTDSKVSKHVVAAIQLVPVTSS
jgi:hypothetical protein